MRDGKERRKENYVQSSQDFLYEEPEGLPRRRKSRELDIHYNGECGGRGKTIPTLPLLPDLLQYLTGLV